MTSVHRAVGEAMAGLRDDLVEFGAALHADPEPAFQEHRACAHLTALLEADEFGVERGVAGLDTAFVASYGSGDGPRVALLAEYDALPGLGHACGHNLIAMASAGAALAVRRGRPELAGTLYVLGTPAEEGGGGKVTMLEHGVFAGLDAALMCHPGSYNWAWAPMTAFTELRVDVHGRAAHATGNPADGVDALAALVLTFNGVYALLKQLPAGSHVQGIVTEGGTATNVVPEHASARFALRALDDAELATLVDRATACAESGARAVGATVDVVADGLTYAHLRDNGVVSGRFTEHMRRLGVAMTEPAPGTYLGSSDIGNVSVRVPAIQPIVAIAPAGTSDHTPQFAAAAGSTTGFAAMLTAAEALACTAVDLLDDAALRREVWAAFDA